MAISSFRNLSDIELCPVLVVLDRRCVPDAIRRIPLILPRLPNTPEWGVRIALVLRELAVAWKPGLVRGLGIFGQAGKHYGQVFSTAAVIAAARVLFVPKFMYDYKSGMADKIEYFGPGYWLWSASMVCAVLAALIRLSMKKPG